MAVFEITEKNFDAEVLGAGAGVTVLVDFWAGWCRPCMALSPLVDEVAAETPSLKVGKINVDNEEALARRFGILSIPTLLVFRDGKQVAKSVGLVPKDTIVDLIGR